MATLTRTKITESGVGFGATAADAAGDDFINTGKEFIYVLNNSASAVTVTITAQRTDADNQQYGNLVKTDAGGSIPASSARLFGPFPPAAFNLDGKAKVTYSSATSVNIAVLTL